MIDQDLLSEIFTDERVYSIPIGYQVTMVRVIEDTLSQDDIEIGENNVIQHHKD